MRIGDVQSGITVTSDSISGTLYSQSDWIWDPFNFHDGIIGSPPYYYLALDFSDNSFRGLTSVVVDCGIGSPVELLNDTDKIVIIEVKEAENLTITLTGKISSLVQEFDLSELVFS